MSDLYPIVVLRPAKIDRSGATRYPKEMWTHIQLVAWIDRQRHDLRQVYNHNPAGGFRPKRTAHWMKRLGQKPGLPDLMFYAPLVYDRRQFVGLALELKRENHGRLTNCQKHWAGVLRQQGWLYVVARGLTQALAAIEKVYPRDAPPVILLASERERRDAVMTALQHPSWSKLSNETLALYCGVAETTVRNAKRGHYAAWRDLQSAQSLTS